MSEWPQYFGSQKDGADYQLDQGHTQDDEPWLEAPGQLDEGWGTAYEEDPQRCSWTSVKSRESQQHTTAPSSSAALSGTSSNGESRGEGKRLNAKICQVSGKNDLRELLHLLDMHQGEWNWVNLTTIIHRVARTAKASWACPFVRSSPQFAVIRRLLHAELVAQSRMVRLQEQGQQGGAQGAEVVAVEPSATGKGGASSPAGLPWTLAGGWAVVAWSFATLGARDRSLFHLLATLARPVLHAFKSFELGNFLWAFAKVSLQAPQLFEAARKQIGPRLDHFSPVSLSMVAWAFVTIQHRPPVALLKSISGAFVAQLDQAESHEISNMCWSLVTAKVVKPEVFKAIGDMAVRKLDTFNIQELANTAWSFSRGRIVHSELFRAIAQLFSRKPQVALQFQGQALANMFWAQAKQVMLGTDTLTAATAVHALLPACCRTLDSLKPQEFSSVLWSVAQLGIREGNHILADRLFQKAASLEPMRERLEALSAQGLTNVLFAFTEFLNGRPEPVHLTFLGMLVEEIHQRLGTFEPMGVSYVIESLEALSRWEVQVRGVGDLLAVAMTKMSGQQRRAGGGAAARMHQDVSSALPGARQSEAAPWQSGPPMPVPPELPQVQARLGRGGRRPEAALARSTPHPVGALSPQSGGGTAGPGAGYTRGGLYYGQGGSWSLAPPKEATFVELLSQQPGAVAKPAPTMLQDFGDMAAGPGGPGGIGANRVAETFQVPASQLPPHMPVFIVSDSAGGAPQGIASAPAGSAAQHPYDGLWHEAVAPEPMAIATVQAAAAAGLAAGDWGRAWGSNSNPGAPCSLDRDIAAVVDDVEDETNVQKKLQTARFLGGDFGVPPPPTICSAW